MKNDFSRYNCQMALPGFNEERQQLMLNARVVIIGAGGLGSPAAQYLTAAGVGTIGIVDYDTVSVSNLHRQILYNPADEGKKKVLVACERLQKQNPDVQLIPHDLKVTSQNIMQLIEGYDLIIDGTDNFETRYLINDAAVLSGKPVIYGAIYQYEGQIAVWNLLNENGDRSPNYRDVFPKVNADQIPNCAVGGVIPTLAGIIGSMQANEAIKYITKTGGLVAGKMLLFDSQTLQGRIIRIGDKTETKITRLVETLAISTISASELQQKIDDGSLLLIDVRSEEEREDFNIGGEHIPLEDLYNQIDEIAAKSIKTVFYCATGKRSGDAVKLIKKRHPDANVFSLENGLAGWE